MDVSQSADDLQGYTSFNAPIINHREAKTTVSVTDGATVVLGGIIRNTLSSTDKKVPFLGDLPLFGSLFRSNSKTTGQTELLVFLTPHIVRTNADAQRLRQEVTKELTKASQDSLNKKIPPEKGSEKGKG
jgi:general secretion pathway protein D